MDKATVSFLISSHVIFAVKEDFYLCVKEFNFLVNYMRIYFLDYKVGDS